MWPIGLVSKSFPLHVSLGGLGDDAPHEKFSVRARVWRAWGVFVGAMPKRDRAVAEATDAAVALRLTGGVGQYAGLVKQRKKRQLCDVELVAAGHSVWAHRCVLASCSKYVRHRPVAPCMLPTRLSTHQVL